MNQRDVRDRIEARRSKTQAGLFALVGALSLWACLALGCTPATPTPAVPVRDITEPASALLAHAPGEYGSKAALSLGPDDRGSADAQAAFAAYAPGVIHEPSLDLVAGAVAKTIALERQPIAPALRDWLFWKCGATSMPSFFALGVAQAGQEGFLDNHLREVATRLNTILGKLAARGPSPMRTSFGVARVAIGQNVVQVVQFGMRAIDLTPLPKKQAAGSTMKVAFRMLQPMERFYLYADGAGGKVSRIAMTAQPDGTVSADVPLPSEPGRYFIEVLAADVRKSETDQTWNRTLLWVPVYVGVEEPIVVDEFIRRPAPNPADQSKWAPQIVADYNAARTALGLSGLGSEPISSQTAADESNIIANATAEPPPDATLEDRLAEQGVPARDFMHAVGSLEFVSEYSRARLLHPFFRYFLLKPNVSVVALGIAPFSDLDRLGTFAVTEYAFQPVRVDPEKDADRVLAAIEALERAAGKTPPERDAALSKSAQALAADVCSGKPMPESGEQIWSRVGATPAELRKRMAAPWMGYDLPDEEVANWYGPLKGQGYVKMGVGVCQGTVDGKKNASFAMLLLLAP